MKLSDEDVEILEKEIMLTQTMKTSFVNTMCCFKKFFGWENREARLRKKTAERFEDALDIRKVVGQSKSLMILFSVLFSKEQLLLFKLNNKHTLREMEPTAQKSSQLPESSSSQEEDDGDHCFPKVPQRDFLQSLLKFPVRSNLDEQLVKGVFATSQG